MADLFRPTKPHALPPDAEIVDKDGRPHVRIRDGKQTKLYPLTKDGKRYLRPVAVWCAEVVHADGKRRRVRFSPNKDAAQVMLAKLLAEIELEKAGGVDRVAGHRATPLTSHLDAWKKSLQAGQRSTEYVADMVAKVRRILDGCGFLMATDLTAEALEQHLAALRETDGRSVQTSNDYLQAARQFARWLVANNRLARDPFARLKPGNVKLDVRHERGEFTADEVAKLLTATTGSRAEFRGLTGPDRAMLYRVALNTGFRAKELAALAVDSFDLTADPPADVRPAAATKNRRPVRQPIPAKLARDLPAFLHDRAGAVWPGTWPTRSAEMIAKDMAAGIPATVATPDGEQVRDFHATRNTFIGNVL